MQTLMSAEKTCMISFSLFLLSSLFITGFFPPEEEGEDITLGLGNEGENSLAFLSVSYTLKHRQPHTAHKTL